MSSPFGDFSSYQINYFSHVYVPDLVWHVPDYFAGCTCFCDGIILSLKLEPNQGIGIIVYSVRGCQKHQPQNLTNDRGNPRQPNGKRQFGSLHTNQMVYIEGNSKEEVRKRLIVYYCRDFFCLLSYLAFNEICHRLFPMEWYYKILSYCQGKQLSFPYNYYIWLN